MQMTEISGMVDQALLLFGTYLNHMYIRFTSAKTFIRKRRRLSVLLLLYLQNFPKLQLIIIIFIAILE